MTSTISPEQQKALDCITKARSQLIMMQPFFGSLALKLKLQCDDSIPTFATDGKHLIYNPRYVTSLPTAQQMACICHEVLHCVFHHMARRGSRQPLAWNMAGDHLINHRIIESRMTLPSGCLMDAKYKGSEWQAETVYDDLMKNQPKQGQKQACNGQHGQPSQSGNGQPQPSQGGSAQPCTCPSSHCSGVRDMPSKDGTGKASSGELEAAKAEWDINVVQAAQIAKAAGALPAWAKRYAEEITSKQVPWQDVLRRFINATRKDDYRSLPPNRRYAHAKLYLPTFKSESVGKLVLGIDVSGSIDSQTLGVFAGELRSILETDVKWDELQVVYWDTAVTHVDVYTPEDIDSIKLEAHGGGGTTPECFFRWIDEDVENSSIAPAVIICMTDLCFYGSALDTMTPAAEVLWVSTSKLEASNTPPFGETTEIKVYGHA